MKLKRKRLISLTVTFAMLFSTIGAEAAASPVLPGIQSTVTADTESETEKETTKEITSGTDEETVSKAENESGEETAAESETETNEETADETEATGEETDIETSAAEEETKEETTAAAEEGTDTESSAAEEETKEETTAAAEEGTDTESSAAEEETKEETTAAAGENTDTESSAAEEETKEETTAAAEEDTDTESSAAEEETEKETAAAEKKPDEETAAKTDEETIAEKETAAADENETEADNLLGDSNNELPADPENPESQLPEIPTSEVHEHSWSTNWSYDENYHWHECDAEDCPAAANSEKDGYAEHTYGDDNICTECGYVNPISPLARIADGVVPTSEEAYEAMIALKEDYPEGMTWTNFTPYGSSGSLGDSYVWNGGYVSGANRGVGCSAFAFILSDAAFGNLPARIVNNFTFDDIKIGDILRVNGNSHSVIVLQKSAGGVVLAEANYNKTVHWGRVMSKAETLTANFIITRYPEGYIPEDDPEAGEVAQDGTAGKLEWTLTNGGVLTFSGNGPIPDYSSDNLPLWNECNVNTIVIEDGVTGIGDYAFYQSDALSIYIPDGITAIGGNAFAESALLSVTIPGTVEDIGINAFRDCSNLTSATVSEGVATIGDNAFRGCTSLTYIDFPASITSVGAGAFMSCSEMTRVRFMPGSQTAALGDGLFAQCWKLSSVTLPQTADRISADMFSSCSSLPSLYIPASVTEIGENPFTSCNALKYIYFGGSEADWNSIATIYLRASLKSTGTTVVFDVEFDDPFAADPNDPGDLLPDEGGDTENPTEPDDGNNPAEPDDGNGPTEPDDDNDPTVPDDSNNPTVPDDSNNPTVPDGGNNPTIPDDGGNPTAPDDGSSAHQHSWSASWSCDQDYHWHECDASCFITDNRDKDGYGAHRYGRWIIDVRATASQNGSRHRDCTVCGYRQTNTIPATGSSDSSSSNSGSSTESSDSSNSSSSSSRNSGSTISTTIRKNSDGSSIVHTTQSDGTVITTTTDSAGKVDIEVRLSDSAISNAKENSNAVSLPIPAVQPAQDTAAAPAITVYTGNEPQKVAIPVVSPTPGTVAVMVNTDGSTEVIKSSVPTENSVVTYLADGDTVKIADNSKSFVDVPAESWFEDAAAFVSARELFCDTTDAAFAPDAPMTYAALMAALASYDGAKIDDGSTWYAMGMEWAAARGINNEANPDSNVVCEDMITALWNYCGASAAADNSDGTNAGISNTQKAMNWAVENGIVNGFEDGSLNPQGQISRAQSAQIIMNLIKNTTLDPAK